MKLKPLLQPLAIFWVSAGAAWWIVASSGRETPPAPTGPGLPVPGIVPIAEQAHLPKPGSSPGEMLSFIKALSAASGKECRRAFFETCEVALRQAIVLRWGAVDPQGCWESLQAVQKQDPSYGPCYLNYMPLLFQQWVRVDYDRAVDALVASDYPGMLNLTAGSMISVAACMGADTWQKLLKDPRLKDQEIDIGPISRVGRPPGSGLNMIAAASAARAAGRLDLATAVGGLLGIKLEANQVDAAIASLKGVPHSARQQAITSIISSLIPQSLPATRRAIEALPIADQRKAAWPLIRAWTKVDPAKAWDWVQARPTGGKQNTAAHWGATTDPVAGAQVLQEAPPSSTRDAAAAAMAENWLSRDAAAMASWVQTLDDPAMQRSVYNKIAVNWAARDPEAAIAALTAPGAPSLSGSNYQKVAGQLYNISPEKARAFVEALPPGRAALAAKGLRGK